MTHCEALVAEGKRLLNQFKGNCCSELAAKLADLEKRVHLAIQYEDGNGFIYKDKGLNELRTIHSEIWESLTPYHLLYSDG